MDETTERALKSTAPHLRMFARNGRWGTCADCPRDSEGNTYPEFCPNTERTDHQLGMDELAQSWETAKRASRPNSRYHDEYTYR